MKKLVLLILSILAFGCDNEPINTSEPTQTLILKKVTKYTGNDGSHHYIAEFDTQGKITQIFTAYTHDNVDYVLLSREYEYAPTSGLITGYTHHPSFVYDENNTIIGRGLPSGNYHRELTHEDNVMIDKYYVNGEYSGSYMRHTFSDNTHTKLLSIEHFSNNELGDKTTFYYEGNNLIEMLKEHMDSDTNTLIPYKQYIFTYDDKINPYKLGLPNNAYLAYSTVLINTYMWEYNLIYTADNNLTQITTNNLSEGTTGTTFIEYTYNDDMYPIESTSSITINGSAVTEIYEYYD